MLPGDTRPAALTGRAIGSHERPNVGASDEWLTPWAIIDALGPFDLDPCAAINRPWATAAEHMTITDDGLSRPWHGIVWCNPPYSSARLWLERLAYHGNGIALIFARTETATFHRYVWARCSALLFPAGRLAFIAGATLEAGPGNAGAPSVLVAYGLEAADRLRRCTIAGAYVDGMNVTPAARPAEQLPIF